jgi:hypothetical protein
VHPGFVLPFLLHIDLEAAHALQAADVTDVENLPAGEGRVLARARLDAGHVVQGLLSHGFLGADDPQPGAVEAQFAAVVAPDPPGIGRLAATGAADGAVAGRVGLVAGRTGRDGALAPAAHELRPQGDLPHGTDGRAGRTYLHAQQVAVLLALGLELDEPLAEGRVRVEEIRLHGHAHAPSGMLVEQGHGVEAQVEDPQPPVAHGARGQHLHGIGQTPGRL